MSSGNLTGPELLSQDLRQQTLELLVGHLGDQHAQVAGITVDEVPVLETDLLDFFEVCLLEEGDSAVGLVLGVDLCLIGERPELVHGADGGDGGGRGRRSHGGFRLDDDT